MADVAKTVAIIFEGQDKTGAALAGIESKIGGIGTEAGAATGKVDQLDSQLEQVGRRDSAIESLATAFKALAAAVVVKEFIDANVQLEKFERAMVLLKGSTEGAATEFEYVRELSRRLGLELFTTADAYTSLTAATKGTTLQGQSTRDIFEAVSIAMSSLGKSSADTQGALLAISQIVSKGNVSLEELRGQLGERLPGAFQLAANAMGMSTSELDKFVSSGNLTAEVFLPKFAAELKKTFGDVRDMEGFTASLNRMKNALDEAYITIGKSGAFDALTKGVQVATAAVSGAVAGFELLGKVIGIVTAAMVSGDFSMVGSSIAKAMEDGANKTRDASNAMLGVKDATDKAAVSVDNVSDALSRRLAKGTGAVVDLEKASKDVDKALKELGIDPKKFEEPIANIIKAFTDLAKNPAVRGDELLSGLLVTLDKIEKGPAGGANIKTVGAAIEEAFKRGALSADQYAAATNALQVKQSGLWDGMIKTTGSLQEQKKAHEEAAKAAEKQKDQAFTLRLELEKLYSNERIKTIEAKVKLDIAEFEYKAKIVESAFESINTSIDSTGKLLGDLWKLMDNPSMTFSDKWALEDQIEKENALREKSFELQKKLLEATIKEIELRTKAMQSGDALIKIDGAGLQPHLEAFMWEILRTIQTRVNADGLKLLLNT
jgi:tape measure domain-containing protein